jgi:hypothetical protein
MTPDPFGVPVVVSDLVADGQAFVVARTAGTSFAVGDAPLLTFDSDPEPADPRQAARWWLRRRCAAEYEALGLTPPRGSIAHPSSRYGHPDSDRAPFAAHMHVALPVFRPEHAVRITGI